MKFEDEETKKAFDEYMDEVNDYNEKVKNGDNPSVTLDQLTNKFKTTFDLEFASPEAKKQYEENNDAICNQFQKSAAETEVMLNGINKKLEEINNASVQDDNYEKEYVNELNILTKNIYDMNTFFINISFGAILLKSNPNYNKGRIDVNLVKHLYYQDLGIEYSATIEDKNYLISEDTFNKIEKYVKDNFDLLIAIAKRQSLDSYEGIGGRISIKIGGILLILRMGNILMEDDKRFINDFKERIINLIIVNTK